MAGIGSLFKSLQKYNRARRIAKAGKTASTISKAGKVGKSAKLLGAGGVLATGMSFLGNAATTAVNAVGGVLSKVMSGIMGLLSGSSESKKASKQNKVKKESGDINLSNKIQLSKLRKTGSVIKQGISSTKSEKNQIVTEISDLEKENKDILKKRVGINKKLKESNLSEQRLTTELFKETDPKRFNELDQEIKQKKLNSEALIIENRDLSLKTDLNNDTILTLKARLDEIQGTLNELNIKATESNNAIRDMKDKIDLKYENYNKDLNDNRDSVIDALEEKIDLASMMPLLLLSLVPLLMGLDKKDEDGEDTATSNAIKKGAILGAGGIGAWKLGKSKAVKSVGKKIAGSKAGVKVADTASKLSKTAAKTTSKVGSKIAKSTAGKSISRLGKGILNSTSKLLGKVSTSKFAQSKIGKVALGAVKQAIEKVGTKGALKAGVKTGAKVGGKTVAKRIPVLGLLAGLGFGIHRALKGDWVGSGMEIASGAASLLDLVAPGAGVAVGLAMDAAIVGRDIHIDNKKSKDDDEGTDLHEEVQERKGNWLVNLYKDNSESSTPSNTSGNSFNIVSTDSEGIKTNSSNTRISTNVSNEPTKPGHFKINAESPTGVQVVTSGFGARTRVRRADGRMSSGYHTAIDLRSPAGNPVKTMEPGIVLSTDSRKNGGEILIKGVSGAVQGFSHTIPEVKKGDTVTAGQIIGRTAPKSLSGYAPHLHYTIRPGEGKDKVNPIPYLENVSKGKTVAALTPKTSVNPNISTNSEIGDDTSKDTGIDEQLNKLDRKLDVVAGLVVKSIEVTANNKNQSSPPVIINRESGNNNLVNMSINRE